MNMLVTLSLWFALMVSSSCGPTGMFEEEGSTFSPSSDDFNVTATPDYDYSATFDYYYVTRNYNDMDNDLIIPVKVTKVEGVMNAGRPITDHTVISRTLLMCLSALCFGSNFASAVPLP